MKLWGLELFRRIIVLEDTPPGWGTITGTLSAQTDLQNALNAKLGTGATQDAIVDGTTYKQYSGTEKTKLAGIADGAEVNVNADWNSGAGDSQILNKPTTMPPASHNNSAHSETYITQSAITTHEGAADPHAGYQKESEKGSASGYAPLDTNSKVPTVNLGGAGASGSNYLRGDQTWATPGGGSPPAWKGNIVAAWGDGDPGMALRHMQAAGVVSPTPTNITITVARCSFFKLDTAITVNKIRWYGVGSTTGIYRVALYKVSDLSRLVILNDFNTAAATWGNGAFSVSLSANELYMLAVAVDTTGTTAGILSLGPTTAATTGQMILPTNWPGNLDINMASPIITPWGFCQFAVTTGALPNPAATLANQAAWTGGMPAFFLDNNNV